MDPVTLATITSAVSILGWEVAKGAANEAGKAVWRNVTSTLGLSPDQKLEDIAPVVAGILESDEARATEIVRLLQQSGATTFGASLVHNIDAEKVIVAGSITGDIHM